ncbi:MAG: aquaporin [Acidobacteriales bacterium]|nr:aquaporin [Terriglobales bacterium]
MKTVMRHWPEYLMEAAELGIFMVAACTFGVILYHPSSAVAASVPDDFLRRLLMGLAMGVTAATIIFSPIGKRSGAHFNPAVTITFFRLGKVSRPDLIFYVLFQFLGGVLGVWLAQLVLGDKLAYASVNYVVTVPGMWGRTAAFGAEFLITAILMTVILHVSNHARLGRYTGLFAAALVATYITLESPVSGMSMNPARTVASAVVAHVWDGAWIYFVAPVLGMLAAAELYLFQDRHPGCAKLHHDNDKRCIFCEHQESQQVTAR